MMLQSFLLVLLAYFQQSEAANWALLVAGSEGWNNYRHQADVCHAYQLLTQHGIPPSNIVTMMVDDIANNPNNKVPGTIVNVPGGPDVYAGVQKDYTGSDVTRDNFLHIFKGEKDQMEGIGSGRVIESGPDDNVFVYYSDHGNKNVLVFPDRKGLWGKRFIPVLTEMHKAKKYKNMVLYIEACFSGSMFRETLPADLNVYAVTAANHEESSFACHYDWDRETYVADEFSAVWMKDAEDEQNMEARTLNQQYAAVSSKVNESHVMQYGDLAKVGELSIGDFIGKLKHSYAGGPSKKVPITDAVPAWEVPYMILKHKLEKANTTQARMGILLKMEEEVAARAMVKKGVKQIASTFVSNPRVIMKYAMTASTPEQMDCYEEAVSAYQDTCVDSKTWDYSLEDIHVFENLCIRGESAESIKAAISKVC